MLFFYFFYEVILVSSILILKDEIRRKINLKNYQSKKNSNPKDEDQT
jgi:hypothetical protein